MLQDSFISCCLCAFHLQKMIPCDWMILKRLPTAKSLHSRIPSKDLICKSSDVSSDSFLLPDAPWKWAIADVSSCYHTVIHKEIPIYNVHYPPEIHFKIGCEKIISIKKMKRSRVVFEKEPLRGRGHCNYRKYWLVFSKVWSVAVK